MQGAVASNTMMKQTDGVIFDNMKFKINPEVFKPRDYFFREKGLLHVSLRATAPGKERHYEESNTKG